MGGVQAKEDWNILILSHHPLDWGTNDGKYFANDLKNFIDNPDTKCRVICQFHGHTHCFKVDKLCYASSGKGTPYGINRIAIPNMCFARNNEYGQNEKYEILDIEFGETTTYNKTADGVHDTAFVVNVINPSEETIYSFCYGAGYDRTVSYAKETIAVTGVTVSPTSLSLEVGNTGTITATVSPSTATDKTVTWTSSAPTIASVSNGIVTAKAAGNATITATTQDGSFTATCAVEVTSPASSPTYTNVLSNMRDPADENAVFNGVGYIDDKYATTDAPYYRSDTATVCLGAIMREDRDHPDDAPVYKFNGVDGIYIKGLSFASGHSRVATVHGVKLANVSSRNTYNIESDPEIGVETTIGTNTTITKLGDKYYKFVLGATSGGTNGAVYFSGIGESGANVIVTINEPIE